MEITVSSLDIMPIYEDPEWEQRRYETARDLLVNYLVFLPESVFRNVPAYIKSSVAIADALCEHLNNPNMYD